MSSSDPHPANWLNLKPGDRLRWIILLGILVAGLATRGWYVGTTFDHPDEPITTGLNHWLDHSWDTNWKLASLPDWFDYDQYNFSSYHYIVHGWGKMVKPLLPEKWSTAREGVVALRTLSVVCGALVVVWTFLIGECLQGWLLGLGGAFLVLVNPQLVADGHYARPEAMLTWMSLLVVWLALKSRWGWHWRLMLCAFLAGIMIAAKVTLGVMAISCGWIALQAAYVPEERRLRHGFFILALAISAVVVVAGFAAGAPGAIVHWDLFVSGIKILANQYSGFHPPHSEITGGRIGLWMASFYIATMGMSVVVLLAMGAWDWLRRRQWSALVLVLLPFLFYFLYFATKRVFFERNLSHILPLGMICAAAGGIGLAHFVAGRDRRAWIGTFLLVIILACLPGVRLTRVLLIGTFSDIDQQKFELYQKGMRARYSELEWRPMNIVFPIDLAGLRKDFSRDHKPVLVQFQEFNDSHTAHNRQVLENDFVSQDVGLYEQPLSFLPCSTLNVYHGNRVVFKIITGIRWSDSTAR